MNILKSLVLSLGLVASVSASAGMIVIDTFDSPSAYNRTLSSVTGFGAAFGVVAFGAPGNSVLSLANSGIGQSQGVVNYSGIALPTGVTAWQIVYELVSANQNTRDNVDYPVVVTVAPPAGSVIESSAFGPISPGARIYSATSATGLTAFAITLNSLNTQGFGADVTIDSINVLYSCSANARGTATTSVGGTSVNGSALSLSGKDDGCGTVPAPASLALLGLGFAGLAAFRRKAK